MSSDTYTAGLQIEVRKSEDRGQAYFGWLDSWHSFSFGEYYDPRYMGFGPLRVMNQDRVEHNVFSPSGERGFDLGRYPKGEFRPVRFDELGVFKVYCDIHKAMILDVVVLANRYFAVTDDDGVFAIEGVPPGSYELKVWHVYGGTHTRALEVSDGAVALEPITVASTKVVREIEEHLDKSGKPYPKKKKRYERR